jgi:serine protease Do
MKLRSLTILLAATFLTTAVAVAQDTADVWQGPNALQDSMSNVFQFSMDAGYLGVYAEDVNRENMSRYNLSQPRGVGITQVMKDSPAEKAGLRKDDVILRVNGESITSVRKLNRLISEIAPDQTARIAISRAGAEQEVTATIARHQGPENFRVLMNERPRIWKWEGPEGDMVFALGNARRIGVSTVELTSQLADYFGVAGGKGVLVTSVTTDGPAAKAGIKAGDVITSIDGEQVDSTGDISRVINKNKEGDVSLNIIRNRSQQTIRVTPTQSGVRRGSLTRTELGRTIVIPRVEFPPFPDVDIPAISIPALDVSVPAVTIPPIKVSVPALNLHKMPSLNIQLPRLSLPKFRVARTLTGPI